MEKEFNIYKRALNYSKELLKFTKKIPKNEENTLLKRRIIRSGTSIGANIHESNSGHSKRDFANYMNIALKSANETVYWFELLLALNPNLENEIKELEKETDEIRRIVASISIRSRKNCD